MHGHSANLELAAARARERSGLKTFAAIRNHDHADIGSNLNDPEDGIGAPQVAPWSNLRPSNEDVRDLVAMSEVQNAVGNVFAFEDTGLDVKVAGKVQVSLHRFAGLLRVSRPSVPGNADAETVSIR